jgi:hypothetical protein
MKRIRSSCWVQRLGSSTSLWSNKAPWRLSLLWVNRLTLPLLEFHHRWDTESWLIPARTSSLSLMSPSKKEQSTRGDSALPNHILVRTPHQGSLAGQALAGAQSPARKTLVYRQQR